MAKAHWYWFWRLRGFEVTAHFPRRDRRFAWGHIVGVQVGKWFIGAISGTEVQSPAAGRGSLSDPQPHGLSAGKQETVAEREGAEGRNDQDEAARMDTLT